jgi:hypothetical protein
VPRDYDRILNWGNAALDGMPGRWWSGRIRYLNHPHYVAKARDKLTAFEVLCRALVPTVDWTTDAGVADDWCREDSDKYHDGMERVAAFARTTTTGQGGSGIVLLYSGREYGPEGDVFPRAPLYTRMFRATHEYRAHVVGDEVFVVKKRRRNGAERNVIRNHDNGYVYCAENVNPHPNVISVGKAAIKALQLDFGAVDILCTEAGEARVLEVNTAPGIEGRTVDFYATNLARAMA